uniref:Ribosomal protein S4 n=1 Tax=Pyramimonas parkeae TaxID=36894 RepID=A0A1D8I1U5_9CHLO|nr:ribosomal protein S4 [Pyramimonas parkeae]YP_009310494.1 ribosomal protein S4 [Pyramimonas parkeae]AOT98950.1 ribosomal protein S4 [Pyramimonas parkeae]AOT98951.1 ribosomal protein S4 [Pyramimonas parkeae]
MKNYILSKACKQTLSFLWHPDRLRQKLKKQIVKKKQISKIDYKKNLDVIYSSKQPIKNLKINSIKNLEMRLDTCLFRMNLFTSFGAARQAIRHGFILVNGKIFHRATSILRPGDCIQYILKKNNKHFIKRNPVHIQTNPKIATGIILFNPPQIYLPINI